MFDGKRTKRWQSSELVMEKKENMDIILSGSIENALQENGRVYLCGNLQFKNGLSHVQTDGYELGMTDYPVFTCEKAHVHTVNREFNYVISGAVKILLLNERVEYVFYAGDLFVIDKNEPHIGKELPGTRILFSKVPGGNDKVLVGMDESLIRWGNNWENEYKE